MAVTQWTKEGETATQYLEFQMIVCYKCAIPFMVPTYFRTKRLEDHESFHCPNGHSQAYSGKTEAQKLRDELEKQKAEAAEESTRLYDMYLDEINKRKKVVREKNKALKSLDRVHKGVCPCCNRTFQNLASHMRQKHPDVAPVLPTAALHTKINSK